MSYIEVVGWRIVQSATFRCQSYIYIINEWASMEALTKPA